MSAGCDSLIIKQRHWAWGQPSTPRTSMEYLQNFQGTNIQRTHDLRLGL